MRYAPTNFQFKKMNFFTSSFLFYGAKINFRQFYARKLRFTTVNIIEENKKAAFIAIAQIDIYGLRATKIMQNRRNLNRYNFFTSPS